MHGDLASLLTHVGRTWVFRFGKKNEKAKKRGVMNLETTWNNSWCLTLLFSNDTKRSKVYKKNMEPHYLWPVKCSSSSASSLKSTWEPGVGSKASQNTSKHQTFSNTISTIIAPKSKQPCRYHPCMAHLPTKKWLILFMLVSECIRKYAGFVPMDVISMYIFYIYIYPWAPKHLLRMVMEPKFYAEVLGHRNQYLRIWLDAAPRA